MRLASLDEILHIEAEAQTHGLSSQVLVEIAGVGCARLIANELGACQKQKSRSSLSKVPRVWILVGPGRNGQDGRVIARELGKENGIHIDLVTTENVESIFSQESVSLPRPHLIVDSIFGFGLNRPLSSSWTRAVNRVNSLRNAISRPLVVSIDVPSGLCANTGRKLGSAIRADLTLALQIPKRGLVIADGPGCTGKIRIVPLGISDEIVRKHATSSFTFGFSQARRLWPRRTHRSNKTHHGRLLILAGSEGMWGAARLATLAAYRAGAGVVTLASHGRCPNLLKDVPEALTVNLKKVKLEALDLSIYRALLIGPGLQDHDLTFKWIEQVRSIYSGPVVIDAGGLTCLGPLKSLRGSFLANWIFTPHTGELARLLKISSQEVESNRFEAAKETSRQCGAIVVLKGFRSIVSSGGCSRVILSGNSALAKAGTGDVLAGLITGLLGQIQDPVHAALLGTYLHGAVADRWVKTRHEKYTLMASDLLNLFSLEFKSLLASRGASGT